MTLEVQISELRSIIMMHDAWMNFRRFHITHFLSGIILCRITLFEEPGPCIFGPHILEVFIMYGGGPIRANFG
jgi:hypothetical protein